MNLSESLKLNGCLSKVMEQIKSQPNTEVMYVMKLNRFNVHSHCVFIAFAPVVMWTIEIGKHFTCTKMALMFCYIYFDKPQFNYFSFYSLYNRIILHGRVNVVFIAMLALHSGELCGTCVSICTFNSFDDFDDTFLMQNVCARIWN